MRNISNSCLSPRPDWSHPLISFSDFNAIILFSCSVWFFNGNIFPFLIKPSLITPSSPSLPCFRPPFFPAAPWWNLFQMRKHSGLSLSPVVQLFPRLSDGKWGCSADRDTPHPKPPPPPPPPPFFPLRTDLLFQQNRDAKWMSGASAARNPFAVQQRSAAGVFSGCRSAHRCFLTDCLWGTEPRCQINRSRSVARKLLTMMSGQLASPQHDRKCRQEVRDLVLLITFSDFIFWQTPFFSLPCTHLSSTSSRCSEATDRDFTRLLIRMSTPFDIQITDGDILNFNTSWNRSAMRT